jgi:hypothetical protein
MNTVCLITQLITSNYSGRFSDWLLSKAVSNAWVTESNKIQRHSLMVSMEKQCHPGWSSG